MILKIIGSAAVLLSSAGCGFYFAGKDSYRLFEFAQMKKALRILISEIRFLNSLPEASVNISRRASGTASRIFAYFGESLYGKNGGDMASLWETSLSRFKKETYFIGGDLDMFIPLGRTFGYLDVQTQTEAIELVIKQIDAESEMIIQNRDKNKKMYLNLGLLCGLAIVVLLL